MKLKYNFDVLNFFLQCIHSASVFSIIIGIFDGLSKKVACLLQQYFE
jgi:hypothetical protein